MSAWFRRISPRSAPKQVWGHWGVQRFCAANIAAANACSADGHRSTHARNVRRIAAGRTESSQRAASGRRDHLTAATWQSTKRCGHRRFPIHGHHCLRQPTAWPGSVHDRADGSGLRMYPPEAKQLLVEAHDRIRGRHVVGLREPPVDGKDRRQESNSLGLDQFVKISI